MASSHRIAFVGWRNAAIWPRALGALWLGRCFGRGKRSAIAGRGCGPWAAAGLAGVRAAGYRQRISRQGQRARGGAGRDRWSFARFEIDRIVIASTVKTIASQSVARQLGAVIEREIDLFGHVADL